MNVMEKTVKILQQPVCDNCLGRQFAQLLSGYTNAERGSMLRALAAMSLDRSKEENKEKHDTPQIDHSSIDMSNFSEIHFHNLEVQKTERKKCAVCDDFFLNLEKWVKKVEKAKKKHEAKTFLIGTKLPMELIAMEESLWERAGIDYCEPLKAEINREVGKLVEEKLGIRYDKNPDANLILNLAENKVILEINPVFIYGEYQKLKRGIPQTRWPSKKYKTSIEEIVAKPFMAFSKATGHKLHGLGREDIDARCLGWRPFVLELLSPEKRSIDLRKMEKKIGPLVRVRKMRPSDIAEVRRIKESKAEKTYTLVVETSKKITRADLKRILHIKSIKQQTPERVLHRRADKFRTRKVNSIKFSILGPKKFRLTVRCEAGLYVKELVSGDSGRTVPSLSALLGMQCRPKDLDVLDIHVK